SIQKINHLLNKNNITLALLKPIEDHNNHQNPLKQGLRKQKEPAKMPKNNNINIFDVANYIIVDQKIPNLTNLKIQKLIFYIYAVYLVKTKPPTKMLQAKLEAWPYGPVFPELYFALRKFKNTIIIDQPLSVKNPHPIPPLSKSCIEYILQKYGNLKAGELAEKTHDEDPWHDAYVNNIYFEDNKITDQAIFDYYDDQFDDFKI
ncbi:Panacea domain-containing protein, partial [Candidatus Phytoplasma prunorum]|uniref:Panacea domain-containing protein n=1 Tax=Candidatus Phytoplasma prunorum TaxID=47565 RepID=UPI002FF431E8